MELDGEFGLVLWTVFHEAPKDLCLHHPVCGFHCSFVAEFPVIVGRDVCIEELDWEFTQ